MNGTSRARCKLMSELEIGQRAIVKMLEHNDDSLNGRTCYTTPVQQITYETYPYTILRFRTLNTIYEVHHEEQD